MKIKIVVMRNGTEIGQLFREELIQCAKNGKLKVTDEIRRSDRTKTITAGKVRWLFPPETEPEKNKTEIQPNDNIAKPPPPKTTEVNSQRTLDHSDNPDPETKIAFRLQSLFEKWNSQTSQNKLIGISTVAGLFIFTIWMQSGKNHPEELIENNSAANSIEKKKICLSVHEVDDLLSHPDDPNRMSAGVVMEEIVPRTALPLILQAIEDYPDTPRFYYLLGRAYEASGNLEKALVAYEESVSRNYPMGHFRLGLFYGEGQEILARDVELCEKHCKLAISKGVEIAQQNLDYFVFNKEGFTNPELFQSIYNKEFNEDSYNADQFRKYSIAFIEPFFLTPNISAPISRSTYAKLAQGAQVQLLGQMLGDMARSRRNNPVSGIGNSFTAGMQEGQDMVNDLVVSSERGRADAELFFSRYGVDSPVADEFFENYEYYLKRLKNASFDRSLKNSYLQ